LKTDMMTKLTSRPVHSAPARRGLVWAAAITVSVGLLAGCAGEKKDKPATQTAAKVNKEEITVHQINFVLGQQRALPPEQAASASRQVLERLIDQELALQKADEQKLDRDPRVVQQIEASRREIIARSYIEKLSEGAPKPTPQEVSAYYAAHPGLFKERRIYSLQELNIQAAPEQVDGLKHLLASAKTFADFAAQLKAGGYKFVGGEAVRAAEQLPLTAVEQFAKLKDGQTIFTARPGGVQVVHLVRSQMQPVDEEKAVPAIQQFLLNQRKRKLIADDLHALRSAAKIDYLGDFAADAVRNPYQPPSGPELPPLTSLAPPAEAGSGAAPQIDVSTPVTAPASMPSGSTLDKGLKGLK